ncbi:MAG: virulence factor [Legionella sp.]
MEADLNDPVSIVDRVYQIWWHWADFHLYVITPFIEIISPPKLLKPELIAGTQEYAFVYPIHDAGSKLSTSKGEEMISSGMSMYKLYMTIEKMISILVERLKSEGVSIETEVQVAFGGHLLAQRKAFESIINLAYNVVVTNFDPGAWGERYLQIVKQNADKFGYPPEAPRDTYKQPHKSSPTRPTR